MKFFKGIIAFVSDSASNLASILKFKRNVAKPSKSSGSFFSIRIKLISAFMITIIPIILLGAISYNKASTAIDKATKTIEDTSKNSTLQTMEKTNEYLELLLSNIDTVSMQIFTNQDVQTFLSADSESTENTYEMLNTRRDVEQMISSFTMSSKIISDIVIVADNISISSSNYSLYDFKLDNLKDTPMFKRVEAGGGKLVWLGKHEELDSNSTNKQVRYSMSAARILKNMGNQNTIGILFIDLKLDVVENLLKKLNLGKGSEVHLISPDGRDISSVQADQTEGVQEATDISKQDFYQSVLKSEEGHGSSDIAINGKKYLMSYSRLGSTGYMLIGLMPSQKLSSAAGDILISTVILVCFAAAFAIIIGLYMAMGMGRTINRIISTAGLAASGDLTVNPVSRRRDELGMLTKSIASMIANMRQLILQASDIAQKVDVSAGTVATTSQQVSAVSHEISRAIQEISQGASAQAEDAEQGSVKINELASKINEVSVNAKAIEAFSKDTMNLTQQGLSSIEDLNRKARETTSTAKAIITDIQALDGHSKSIGKIVKVISGIADQTNLLALNAAIEAARAGEMGRGFAVVADEVRKLAEQSMAATREITSIINETQNQTTHAAERAVLTEEILKSQDQAVNDTLAIFKKISSSMEQLVKKVEQIMTGVEEMDQNKEYTITAIQNISAVSEETAASSEEVTASTQEQLSSIEELAAYAQELGDAAKNLSESISKFKVR